MRSIRHALRARGRHPRAMLLAASLCLGACAEPASLSAALSSDGANGKGLPGNGTGVAPKGPLGASCEAMPLDQLFADPQRVIAWGWSVAEVTVTADRGPVQRTLEGLGDFGKGALLEHAAYDVAVGEAEVGVRLATLPRALRAVVPSRSGSIDLQGASQWREPEAWKGDLGRASLSTTRHLLLVVMPEVTGKDEFRVLAAFPVDDARRLLQPALGQPAGAELSAVFASLRKARAEHRTQVQD